MKKKHAVLVHINPMAGITPLTGGYLKTFAELEPEIRSNWNIDLYSTTTDCSASRLISDLVKISPDVIGFSLFVWNIGLVQRILPALRGVLPATTQFLVGGVQIMNSAQDYIDSSWENIVVCNGEGEQTFREYLMELQNSVPKFENIGGITFLRDGEFITSNPHKRMKHLEEIPSPYLNDVFEDKDMAIALLETNRGCPYKCEYCFWGGAIGQKIHRLPLDRLKEEIAYISRKRTRSILLCDANFGIFPHDSEISELFVKSREKTGYPVRVTYSSAKNNPQRAVEIATILAKGKVLSSQPISLQTMSPVALEMAKRSNIKQETYLQLQQSMNELGVASFIELIWPLPGETLESFKKGIQDLCCMSAQAFGVYPLVWLKNVGYEDKKEELGVVTLDEADPVGGASVAIRTNEVTHEDWIKGMVFTNSVMLLYDCRGLFHTLRILNALGIESYRDVFDRFVQWMEQAPTNDLTKLWREGANSFEEMYKFTWRGAVVETVVHGCRVPFNDMITKFCDTSTNWTKGMYADLISAAVEFDILSRPFAYANTSFDLGLDLKHLKLLDQTDRTYVIESAFDFPSLVKQIETTGKFPKDFQQAEPIKIVIDHKRNQFFRMPYKRDEDHHQFCHEFVTEIGNYLPIWETTFPTKVAVGS